MASTFRGRPVEEDASSSKTIRRAAEWLRSCAEQHSDCHNDLVSLPARILDLQPTSEPNIISLCEPLGALGHYAALSHCWGQTGYFTTMKASLQTHASGINVADLPRTFQDAVLWVRQLGMRYLWIDSLCICQDDKEEWARESAKMASLYSNAYLTIAADSARDDTDGFCTRAAKRQFVPIEFTTPEGSHKQILAFLIPSVKAFLDREHLELRDEPLTKRAWALQERFMSMRLLHFGSDQLYYECNENFLSEDGFRTVGRYNSIFPGPKATYYPISRESQHSAHHALWYKILEDFTRRELTVRSDRLPALSGLARVFEARIGAKYVAGLWSNALIEGLAWTPFGRQHHRLFSEPRPLFAPSWSWASYYAPLASGTGLGWVDVATVLDYHVELKTSNPHGEVSSGWIKLRAPLVPLTVSDDPPRDDSVMALKVRLRTATGNSYGFPASYDYVVEPQEQATKDYLRGLTLYALVLCSKAKTPDDDSRTSDVIYKALLVAPAKLESSDMYRLGHILVGDEAIGSSQVLNGPEEYATVKLI